jgi:hypothetical protein
MLKDKGFSVSSISSQLNVHRQSVYDSLNCKPNSSRRIRLFISSVIGRPPSLLFSDLPERIRFIDDIEYRNFEISIKNSALVKTCENSVQKVGK